MFGGVSFLAEGVADLQEYNYKQPLLYYVNIDGDKVAQVIPLVQSTMGYEAEISLFAGKTCEEIRGITDLEGGGCGHVRNANEHGAERNAPRVF